MQIAKCQEEGKPNPLTLTTQTLAKHTKAGRGERRHRDATAKNTRDETSISAWSHNNGYTDTLNPFNMS